MARFLLGLVLLFVGLCLFLVGTGVAFAQAGTPSQAVDGSTPTCFYTSSISSPPTADQCYASKANVLSVVAGNCTRDYTTNYGANLRDTCTVRSVESQTIDVVTCNLAGGSACTNSSMYVSIGSRTGTYTCPDGATLSGGQCYCSAGKRPTPGKNACEQACVAGQTLSSGYYDIGTNAQASPLTLQCKGGCWAAFDGESPAGSATVDNTKHWYAKGSYVTTGGACTTPVNAVDGLETVPQDSCDPAKYDKGTVNGKTVCTLKGTNTPVPPAPASSSSTNSSSTTTGNADGSSTTKETSTTTNPNGSSTTTTTTTTTNPDGSKNSSTVVVNTPSPTSDDEEKAACEKNPSDKGCGGSPASIGSSWTSKTSGKSFSSVISAFAGRVGGSPLVTSIHGFFTVSTGGSCPSWSTTVPYINATLDFTAFCSSTAMAAYAVVRAVLLVLASWLAFRIALDN